MGYLLREEDWSTIGTIVINQDIVPTGVEGLFATPLIGVDAIEVDRLEGINIVALKIV